MLPPPDNCFSFPFIYWFFSKSMKVTKKPVSDVLRAWWPSYWSVDSAICLLRIWMILASEFLKPSLLFWLFLSRLIKPRHNCFRRLKIMKVSIFCLSLEMLSFLSCFFSVSLLFTCQLVDTNFNSLLPLKKNFFLGFLSVLFLPTYPRNLQPI